MITELTGSQRKYLRAAAHHLNPLVLVGKLGMTDALVRAAAEALDAHELVKVRFLDFKDRKREWTEELARRTGAHIVGSVGHIYILYRQNPEEEKRVITLPGA